MKHKFLESDSSDSKYSNEDRQDKDHFACGEEALRLSLKKLKVADKIVQKNEMLGKSDRTSHVVQYFNDVNKKNIAPKSLGMIHRKPTVTEINLKQQPLRDPYAEAFANALNRAKFVDSLVLTSAGLSDKSAISILNKMNKETVKLVDISYNPNLTEKSYDVLCKTLMAEGIVLERLELEGNMIGDNILKKLCSAIVCNPVFKFLNVSKCGISDKGA